jgi:phosphatidylserine/phosphatidylglycerophosphate/cardiolipin synthase-like enzyme
MIVSPPASSLQFLGDGLQQPQQVAEGIASFLRGAQRSLDVAIYDSGLSDGLAEIIAGAFSEARERGVEIRIAYHADTDRSKGIPAPSSQTEVFVESLDVPSRAVGSQRNLMHHKYVIRDAGTDGAAVLTGSTNWGQDAWSREENVILQLFSSRLAEYYRTDFEQVWAGRTDDSGKGAGGSAELTYDAAPMPTTVWFAPAEGEQMAHAAATLVAQAKRRIVIASPVLTSGSILTSLRDVLSRQSVPVRGIVDRTQMDEVRQQWGENPNAGWKIDAFESIARQAGLVGKVSTPWTPEAVHDYMHLKMIVVDDDVLTGSFNFSHSGEDNAENLLQLHSPGLADVCVGFIDRLIERYGATPAAGPD